LGRQTELDTWLEQHATSVYRFAMRLAGNHHLAEDLTQETMLRGWKNRSRLREPEKRRVWLLQITANLWRDRLRRSGRRPEEITVTEDQVESRLAVPFQVAVDREDLQRALAAMDSLPERQRGVLYLHTCEGLSLAEIATVMKINSGAAKTNLSLARKRMREMLSIDQKITVV